MKHDWEEQDGSSLLLALSHCTNLETLTLNFASSEWSCAKGSKAVILPKLREFKFAKPQEDSLKFLNFINTPRLAHLDVFLRHPIKHHTLSSFITRQADRSQDTGGLAVSLQVSFYAGDPGDEIDNGDEWDTHFEEWDIPRFIRKIPNITHLTLSNCIPAPKDRKNEDDFFGYLGCWDPETLPHLRHLKILHFPPTYPLISVEMFAEGRQLDSLVVKYDSVRLPDSCEGEAAQLAEKMRLERHPLDITYPKICNNTDLQDMYFKSR
ncbi:hypothetical protein MD484_g260, partial [Candolleomyces efflorescens]